MEERRQGNSVVSYDIRYRQGAKPHFSINDIHFSPLQSSDQTQFNVTKMILIEKQPRYPIYWGKIVDGITGTVKDKMKEWFPSMGSTFAGVKNLADTAGQAAGALFGNVYVDSFSGDRAKLDDYYGDPNRYLNNVKNLFTTLTTDHIMTYELPFLSDYFMEADGSAGWKHVGAGSSDMAMQIGGVAKTLSQMNVGYPITPNWEYSPKVPYVQYDFHLINDTTKHLSDNVKFLIHFIPGMLHVLLSMGSTDMAGVGDGSGNLKSTTGSVVGDVVHNVKNLASNYMSLFKSPNVYEVIVPARFRWLWCTLETRVTCVGKIYHDSINLEKAGFGGKVRAFSDNPRDTIIGFPEAFKVNVSVRSLLPQSFNEYLYFLQSNPNARTETYTRTMPEQAGNEIYGAAKEAGSAVLGSFRTANDAREIR